MPSRYLIGALFLPTVAPSVTDAPDDLTVVQPEDATFTCVATARPRPNITWWRVESNGSLSQVIEEANVTSITEMMSGERVLMNNLTIESAQPSDAGEYVCVAENGAGNISATATLVVHGGYNTSFVKININFGICNAVKPTLSKTPDDLVTVHPQNANFQCVSTAIPRPTISWWRWSSNSTTFIQVMEEANVASITEMMSGERVLMSNLTIESAQPSNAGDYTCVAENEVSNTSATATLVVHGESFVVIISLIFFFCCIVVPSITFPSNNHIFYTNEFTPAVFQCTATGIPALEISWYRNGTVLNNSTDARVTLNEASVSMVATDGGDVYQVNRMLTLDNAMDSDSGDYTCVADNGNAVQPSVSQEFELFVKGKRKE